jgi:hypothetical protein
MGKNKNRDNEDEGEDDKDYNILEDDPDTMIHEMDTESNINIDEDLKTKCSRDNSRKNTVSSFLVNSNFDSSLSTSNNNNKSINSSLILNFFKNEENSKANNFFEKQLKRQRYTELKIQKKEEKKN